MRIAERLETAVALVAQAYRLLSPEWDVPSEIMPNVYAITELHSRIS